MWKDYERELWDCFNEGDWLFQRGMVMDWKRRYDDGLLQSGWGGTLGRLHLSLILAEFPFLVWKASCLVHQRKFCSSLKDRTILTRLGRGLRSAETCTGYKSNSNCHDALNWKARITSRKWRAWCFAEAKLPYPFEFKQVICQMLKCRSPLKRFPSTLKKSFVGIIIFLLSICVIRQRLRLCGR